MVGFLRPGTIDPNITLLLRSNRNHLTLSEFITTSARRTSVIGTTRIIHMDGRSAEILIGLPDWVMIWPGPPERLHRAIPINKDNMDTATPFLSSLPHPPSFLLYFHLLLGFPPCIDRHDL
jgi:hypothetical protein